MKYRLILFVAAAALLVSCEEKLKIQGESCTLRATAEQAVKVTKVSLNTTSGVFEWQGGDTLAVCSSKSGRGRFVPFAIIGGGRSSEAEFAGEIADSSIKECAVFPYVFGSEPYFQDGDLYVTCPSTSQYWEKSSRAPMFASVAEYDRTGVMDFRHLGGVINVKIAPVPSGTAEIVVMAGSRIAGSFRVNRPQGEQPFICTEPLDENATGNSISVTFAKLVAEQEQMYVQFPLPVGDYSFLRFQARNVNGALIQAYRSVSEVSVSRGEVINLVPGEDPMPGFKGIGVIGVSAAGIENGTFNVPLKNNGTFQWTLSVVGFDGCITAASVSGSVLTYSVGPNDSDTESRTGHVTLMLSDPTGMDIPVTATFTVQQSSKSAKYYVKVTSEPASWEGRYLIVYETESEVYAMNSDTDYQDSNCPGFTLPLEERGICQSIDTPRGEIIIRKHAPDPSGGVNKTAVEGAYTMFLDEATGFGRYALESFGFNNNSAFGRFVTTFSYDAAGHHPVVVSKTKSQGDSYLKYDSANFTFGFGIPSEISDAGRFVDIQLYRLED